MIFETVLLYVIIIHKLTLGLPQIMNKVGKILIGADSAILSNIEYCFSNQNVIVLGQIQIIALKI